MINLTKTSLPNTVRVCGKDFFIETDFRMWLSFENNLKDIKAGGSFDVTDFFIGEPPSHFGATPEDILLGMLVFAHPKNELPRKIKNNNDSILVDFTIDADLIFAAFLQQYQINLLDPKLKLHWHEFLALFNALTDATLMAKVMSYRAYTKSSDKKDPYEDLKRAWEIRVYNAEEEHCWDELDNLLN